MCGPAALPLAAAGTVAIGSMIGGLHAKAQSGYEASVNRLNAGLSTEQANDSVLRGRDEARQFFRQVGQTKGSQVAAMAANGIDTSEGSALRVQQDTAMMAGEDASNLYTNVGERTRGFQIEAINYRAAGTAAKMRGRAAMTKAAFDAAGSLMGGFSQMRGMKAKMGGG